MVSLNGQQRLITVRYVVSESINKELGIQSHSSRRALTRSKTVCGDNRWPTTHLPRMSQNALLDSRPVNTQAIPFV
ncbi:hypothetical protein TNCV_1437531 [Trichonephila clavipes]|nr:hypothetical protein TNCV_1437531 [Trichonephila clavipes]